ncbi:MAG: nitroreductase family protein [Elusimicrobiaceae bacterium]|nr:nitroreductase family protein [Elusimicrobiaceae bacterium]
MTVELLNVVMQRRSVRKYKSDPVGRDLVNSCIEAARLAPSACNSQPWKFVVLDEPARLAEFAGGVFEGLYSMTAFAGKAPVLVAIVSEKSNVTAWIGNQVQQTTFRLVDIGIACENFVLQAQSLGLGTCILGWFNAKKAAEMLGCPAGKKVELLISLGYPDEAPAPRPRKAIEAMSSYGKY